ncbi:MAG: caspase family protein [Bacteroidota bacterium]
MSQQKVYALLIAIDKYKGSVPPLNGCVRDSQDVETYLRSTVSDDQLHLRTLRDEEATKANIVEGFLGHLTQAGENDVVFVHFSGHGSRERAPQQFWFMEPDKMNETMVCVDSRQVINGKYHRDLADKEIGALIHKVTSPNPGEQEGPHMLMIMDCCHAGSGSRSTEQVTERTAPGDKGKTRKLENYVFFERQELRAEYQPIFDQPGQDAILPRGKHILMAGCQSFETAKELTIGGKTGGVFTYALLDTLKKSGGDISYRDLLQRASGFVKNRVNQQTPQLDVVGGADSSLTFLGGSAKSSQTYYNLSFDRRTRGWVIDAGAVNGIPFVPGDPTTLNVFDANANLEETEPFAVAEVVKVESSFSMVRFEGSNSVINPESVFKATLLNLPVAPTAVLFEAEKAENASQKAAVEALKQQLNIFENGKPCSFITEADEEHDPEYKVVAYTHQGVDKWRITRPDDERPLIKQLEGFTPETSTALIKQLIDISRWDRVAELENPATGIPPGAVKIELLGRDRDPNTGDWSPESPLTPDAGGTYRLEYEIYEVDTDGFALGTPEVRIKIKNTASRPYYVGLFLMESNFALSPITDDSQGKLLRPGEEVFAIGGESFTPEVAVELINLGLNEDTAYLKLMVSSTPFNTEIFKMEGFEYAQATREILSVSDHPLEFLVDKSGNTRALRPKKPRRLTDWRTERVSITSVHIDRSNSEDALAQSGVSLSSPAGVEVSLSSVPEATRSLGGNNPLVCPRVLTENPEMGHLIELIPGRGSAPAQTVLEVSTNASEVSAQSPLEITFGNEELKKGEAIMAIVSDGELFYPVGLTVAQEDTQGPKLAVEQLPENGTPSVYGTRGLGKTFKLVFQKIFSKHTDKITFDYPRLSVVEQKPNGKLAYPYDVAYVQHQVAGASRILLLIHGFTGEVQETFFDGNDDQLYTELKKSYDLILGFDYESFNTRIDRTAIDLEKMLEQVGLKGMHNKTLDILTHSMGGLISRVFIEGQNGDMVVNHLYMAGTPNGGSPWPSIKTWATFASSLVLNHIPVIGWIFTGLGFVLGAANALDKVTEDMATGSDLLVDLQEGFDPQVKYTVIAGNTSDIPDDSPHRSMITKILDKVGLDALQQSELVDLLFKQPNDIAASVDSILKVEENRSPAPEKVELPSNHFNYFVPNAKGGVMTELLETIRDSGHA